MIAYRICIVLFLVLFFMLGCSGNLAVKVLVKDEIPDESIAVDLYQESKLKKSSKTDSSSGLVVFPKLSFNKSYRLEVNPESEIPGYSSVDTIIKYTRKVANDTVKISLGVNYTEISGKVLYFDEKTKKYQPVYNARVFISYYPSGEEIPVVRTGNAFSDRTDAEGNFSFQLDVREEYVKQRSGKRGQINIRIQVIHPEFITYSYPGEGSINAKGKDLRLFKNNDIGRIIILKKQKYKQKLF